MRIPLQLAVIFAICVAGEFLHRIVGIPLPGNIIGMVLLLALLCLKIIKPEQISGVSSFFLNHLALFFLPPSIAIMAVGDEVLSKWHLLLVLCIVFTLADAARRFSSVSRNTARILPSAPNDSPNDMPSKPPQATIRTEAIHERNRKLAPVRNSPFRHRL